MRKNMKKVLSVGLAAAMTVTAFAGCGNKSGSAGGDSSTLVIGGSGPLTGQAATYGQAVKNGEQLAVDEINKAGGVNGMKLKLNFQDDEADAEKAVNAYNTTVDAGAKVFVGTTTSGACEAVADKSNEDGMFLISPSASSVGSVKNDNQFRVCFNDPNQGSASADYIASKKLAKKVAIIYKSSDVYSSGIYEKFVAEAKTKNLSVVASEAFTADSNTDFSAQIQKVKDSGADLLFLPLYYEEAALILQQADKAGLKIKVFGCDGLDGLTKQLKNNLSLTEGVILLTPFAADAKDKKTQDFVKAYKAAYNNEVPIQFAADAYDAVYTVKAALEKAGIKDASIDRKELCDKLKAVMTQITVEGVTGTMTWDASGEPTKDPKAMVIKNGEYKAMD